MNNQITRNNIWIRANAGSGKTTRLIRRYNELLDSGVQPWQILCITYTNAAALEMKNRIKRERTSLQDKDLKIMTIHSFCQDLLIKHNLLKKDTSIINSDYRQKSKLANRITHQLKDDAAIAVLSKNAPVSELRRLIIEIIDNQNSFLELFDNAKTDDLLPRYVPRITEEMVKRRESDVQSALKFQSRDVLEKITDNADDVYDFANWYEVVMTLKGTPRKRVPKAPSEMFYRKLQEYFIKQQQFEYISTNLAVLEIARKVLALYKQFKQEMNVISYDDILYEALKFAKEHGLQDEGYEHIMLDEAQDTNPISWKIIYSYVESKLKNQKPCSIFVVGDEKQSIYSFQGANLDNYFEYQQKFETLLAKTNSPLQYEELTTSYRSCREILQFVDDTFNQQKSAFNVGEKYIIKHNVSEENAKLPEQIAAIIKKQYDLKRDKNDQEDWVDRIKKDIEQQKKDNSNAIMIADDIVNFYNAQKGSTAIIVPKRSSKNGFAYDILWEVQKLVDNVNLSPDIATKCIYFFDLLTIFKFAILQNDDMNLACLLKSEFFNLTDTDIEEIKNHTETLFESLQIRSWQNERLKKIYTFLNDILEMQEVTLTNILIKIKQFLEKENITTYNQYVSLLGRMIAEYTKTEEWMDYNLRGFLQYVDNDEYKDKDARADEGIYFSTIHGVKGLEFDNVVLMDLEESGSTGGNKCIFFNDGTFWYNQGSSANERFDNEQLVAEIEAKQNKRDLEEIRLLYVAITRARRRFLYISNASGGCFGKMFGEK